MAHEQLAGGHAYAYMFLLWISDTSPVCGAALIPLDMAARRPDTRQCRRTALLLTGFGMAIISPRHSANSCRYFKYRWLTQPLALPLRMWIQLAPPIFLGG